MRNLLIAMFCVLCVVSAFAQDAAAPAAVVAPAADAAAPVVAPEYKGIIEVTPAEEGKTEATVVLDMGEKSYQLVAADAEKLAALVALDGKTVTVKGELVAAADAEALESIKVESCVEVTEAPATDAPATDAPAADAKDAE